MSRNRLLFIYKSPKISIFSVHLLQLANWTSIPDGNKIYCGKVSVLFVDMRDSTKLPDRFNTEQLVKIYRSYIRTVVQAIRYSGGVVRDFMGDGVIAVFVDDENEKSEDKAVHAARYITTAIDKLIIEYSLKLYPLSYIFRHLHTKHNVHTARYVQSFSGRGVLKYNGRRSVEIKQKRTVNSENTMAVLIGDIA